MEFRILGPLEVYDEGRALRLEGAKQRALLAVLLLHAGQVVSVDRLIDALWGERPPPTADHALRVYVSELRKILRTGARDGREVLLTRRPGYVLQVGPEEVDLRRFEGLSAEGRRALAEGDPATASAKIGEALELWRGPALADFVFEPFAESEISRLEELKLSALEDRMDADLALGRQSDLIAELRSVVAEHPLRERFREQLMLALYRSGRQAEALDAYRDARRALAEELGIDPSLELQQLEQAILRQDTEIAFVPRAVEEARPPIPTVEAEPPREARKVVTVLFAGVEGSTAAGGAPDPEWLRGVTARFLDRVKEAAERHGGIVERPVGDAVVAVFGVPRVHEDDALRAVRAATEMREALQGLHEEVEREGVTIAARIGVDTGEVVSGEAGADHLLVTGDVVGAAAGLQRLARSGEVLVGERTHRLVRDAVTVEPLEPSMLPDGTGPAFRLIEVTPGARGVAPRLESPMVGREQELTLLRQAFERSVRERACHLFTVLGSAGVGKTRLIEEFARTATPEASVLKGRCLAYGEGITFWPIAEAVRQAAGIGGEDSVEEARWRIGALVEGEDQGSLIADRIAQMMGLSESAVSPGETLWSVRRLLEVLAGRRPLVLVIEDLHWAEPTLLDLIENVAEWSRDAPILLVCTARTELLDERPGWSGGKPNAASVLLASLSDEETDLLIDNLLGRARLAGEVRSRILEAAQGNPLFVEQMLSMLVDDGFLRRRGQRWVPVGDPAPIPVPTTIRVLLAARLDRLEHRERRAIECASVVGKEFGRIDVEQLVPEDIRAEVADLLMALVRKDLVRPEKAIGSGDEYRFRHILVQGAAYGSIPKQVRADLHERFAGWIETSAGPRVTEVEEILGHHLAQAFRYRAELGPVDEHARELAQRGGEHLASAGHRAFARGDMPAAVSLFSSASSLLPPDDRGRIRFLPELGTALVEVGEMEQADDVLAEAIERGGATGDLGVKARALFYRRELHEWTGATDILAICAQAEAMIPTLEARGDDGALSWCWRTVSLSRPNPARWVEAIERAMEHARRGGDRQERFELLGYLSLGLLVDETPVEQALDRCDELIEMAEGDRVAEASVRIWRARLLTMAGRFDEARRDVARARATFEELGLRLWLAAGWTITLAEIELMADDPAAAERALRRGRDALEEMGAAGLAASETELLARALYEQGRYEQAGDLVRPSEEAKVVRMSHATRPALAERAKLLARAGQTEEAERLAREAVAVAGRRGINLRADELMALAEVLRLCGRPQDAVPVVEEALELYERKGNVVLAGRARALLAELAPGSGP